VGSLFLTAGEFSNRQMFRPQARSALTAFFSSCGAAVNAPENLALPMLSNKPSIATKKLSMKF